MVLAAIQGDPARPRVLGPSQRAFPDCRAACRTVSQAGHEHCLLFTHPYNSERACRMPLQKTEKAKLELASKERVLNLRERSALFLADGRKTRNEMQELLQDDGSILKKLIADGYLLPAGAGVAATAPVASEAPARQVAVTQPAPLAEEAAKPSSDNFEGKRSLATTRMFLFDICERMFVRKMPALAAHYRDQLREARDRESMMVIARDIILNVEEIAGADRADGLSERIAMLLPSEQ